MKNSKINNEESRKCEPIIFMNSPISTEENDAIGISSAVDSIKMAIEDGAKMIGIVAEYGAGKSSITEMLAADENYKNPIYINMWDSIQDNNTDENQITNLTKSFIYQLAMGKSSQTANHVNKMLSKNYNIVSFSIGMKKFWIYAILATIFVAMFMVLDNITIKTFTDLFGEYTAKANVIGYILLLLKPLFLIGGIILGVLGIKNTNIAYSRWKPENRRDTEINEVFAAYTYVYNKLLDNENSKVVVIEDLDRIGNQESIIGFLKELYRFNNLNIKSKKKKPVFLVSISSETYVRRNESSQCDDEYIYTKIFDYIISLKPLHYDDYQMVLKEIIFSDENKKNKLNKLLNEDERIVGDKLPLAFEWLYRGENLTIRELKDRLNKAIALLVNLKNKNYDNNPYISFRTCVCVVYLEQKYPKEFYEITHQEEKFSRLIQESYIWRNDFFIYNYKDITEKVEKFFPNNKMAEELAVLICNGVIDTDFRMYFYSFPKGSYIKDVDERDICNYIELPNEYKYDLATLDAKISRIEKKEKLSIIEDVILGFSKNKNKTDYPKVIFENEILFNIAYKDNPQVCVHSLFNLSNLDANDVQDTIRILIKIQRYSGYDDNFTKRYVKEILEYFEGITTEEILVARETLISGFKDKIILLKDLYICPDDFDVNLPIISEEEISKIDNIEVSLQLIDKSKITRFNYEYIEKAITTSKLNKEVINIAESIQNEVLSKISFNKLSNYVYEFLSKNLLIDNKMFALLCEEAKKDAFEKDKLCKYLNGLDSQVFTEEYYSEIDELCIVDGIGQRIIVELLNKKLYKTPLLYCANNDCLELIDFQNADKQLMITQIGTFINDEYPDIIIDIRKGIITQDEEIASNNYIKLFYDPYPFISKSELYKFNTFAKAIILVDGSKITDENIKYIIEYINFETREMDDCYKIFDHLFNESEYFSVCTNVDLIQQIVYGLDYNKVKFDSMNNEQKSNVVDMLSNALQLSNGNNVKDFMNKVGCLIEPLERILQETEGSEEYISLVNNIGEMTDYSKNLIKNEKPQFPLCDKIANYMYKEGYYEHYAVGKIMYNDEFIYPMEKVSDETLIKLYYSSASIFEYLSNNKMFIQMMWEQQAYYIFVEPTWEMLKPFTQFDQTKDFFEYVIETMDDNNILEYLRNLNSIKTSQDSIAIADLIVGEKHIGYLEDEKIYKHVQFRLWESDKKSVGKKGNVTRQRNKYLALKKYIVHK